MKLFYTVLAGALLFTGCASNQPKINFNTLYGLKDYIVQKRANNADDGLLNIIAENKNETLIESRIFNQPTNLIEGDDIVAVLNDSSEYCQAIGGQSIYGDLAFQAIKKYPTSFNFDYVKHKTAMNKQGQGQYAGFFQCFSSKDGFQIDYMLHNVEWKQQHMIGGGYMITYSHFFHITHDKEQKLGFKTWLFNANYQKKMKEYQTLADVFATTENGSVKWWYERAGAAQRFCTLQGGTLLISNAVTKYYGSPIMSMDEYLLLRSKLMRKNEIDCEAKRAKGEGCSIVHVLYTHDDTFYCENKENKAQEFTLSHQNNLITYKTGLEKF